MHPLTLHLQWDSYMLSDLPKAVSLNSEVCSWHSGRHYTQVLSNHTSIKFVFNRLNAHASKHFTLVRQISKNWCIFLHHCITETTQITELVFTGPGSIVYDEQFEEERYYELERRKERGWQTWPHSCPPSESQFPGETRMKP